MVTALDEFDDVIHARDAENGEGEDAAPGSRIVHDETHFFSSSVGIGRLGTG